MGHTTDVYIHRTYLGGDPISPCRHRPLVLCSISYVTSDSGVHPDTLSINQSINLCPFSRGRWKSGTLVFEVNNTSFVFVGLTRVLVARRYSFSNVPSIMSLNLANYVVENGYCGFTFEVAALRKPFPLQSSLSGCSGCPLGCSARRR